MDAGVCFNDEKAASLVFARGDFPENDLRRAEESYAGCASAFQTDAAGDVQQHGIEVIRACFKLLSVEGGSEQRSVPGQANLAAVGVAGELEIEAQPGGKRGDIWRMMQEDAELIGNV